MKYTINESGRSLIAQALREKGADDAARAVQCKDQPSVATQFGKQADECNRLARWIEQAGALELTD